jgi:hypothetical protein
VEEEEEEEEEEKVNAWTRPRVGGVLRVKSDLPHRVSNKSGGNYWEAFVVYLSWLHNAILISESSDE